METQKNLIQTQVGTQLVVYTKNENAIIASLEGEKIINEDDLKITVTLKNLFVLIGLSNANTPTQQQFEVLRAAFRQVLGTFTIKEVMLAVEMSLKGQIDYELNLYGKPFSVQFIAKLMLLYKKKRSPVRLKMQADKRELESEVKLSQDEKDSIMDNAIAIYINDYMSGNIPEKQTFHYYDHLVEKGKINLSPDEKNKLMEDANALYVLNAKKESEITSDKDVWKKMLMIISGKTSDKAQIILLAKDLAFKNWVKSLVPEMKIVKK